MEQQQEEMANRRGESRPPVSAADQKRRRQRQGLVLSRERLMGQLRSASHARHRQMLEQAIAELDKQLASFDEVTDTATGK